MRYQSVIAEKLRRSAAAETSAKGPIKTMFTFKELMALHLAADAILELAPEVDGDGAMKRGMRAAAASLEAQGFRFIESTGWVTKAR